MWYSGSECYQLRDETGSCRQESVTKSLNAPYLPLTNVKSCLPTRISHWDIESLPELLDDHVASTSRYVRRVYYPCAALSTDRMLNMDEPCRGLWAMP